MAEPLIQVVSFTIFPESLPCEVYGSISVYDEYNPEHIYPLYERDSEHSEVISKIGQVLLLTGLDIVFSISKPVMTISLKDKAHNHALIANGNVHFDYTTSNDYEEFKFTEIKGEHGHTRVNYIAMPCAVVAELRVSVLNYDKDSPTYGGDEVPAFGNIVAQYCNTYGLTKENLPITILEVPLNESIPLFFRTGTGDTYKAYLQLTRKLVAVPVYATLLIEADLRERFTDTPFLCASVETRVLACCHTTLGYVWDEPMNYETKINCKQANLCSSWHEPFRLRHSSITHRLTPKCMWSEVGCTDDDYLLEVYSVFIGRENDNDLSVSGTISIQYEHGTIVIFDRDDKNPDRLLNGRKLLSIMGHPKFMHSGYYHYITVNLKDADNQFLIEDGVLAYVQFHIAEPDFEYDRLLCAVFKGKHCYCAVHYSHFRRAVRMEVKCVLLCKGIDVASVYGTVCTWPDIFDYSSDYNKKYYRRILFDKSQGEEDFLKKVVSRETYEHELIEVELSRSCVAMPGASTLYIDVDLYASPHLERGPIEHLKDTLKFRVGDKSPVKIKREDYDILFYMVRIPGHCSEYA